MAAHGLSGTRQADIVRRFYREGANFVSSWRLRTELGIEGTVNLLPKAFEGTEAARRAFMADVLGIRLKPEVLPFSNLSAALPPFILSSGRILARA